MTNRLLALALALSPLAQAAATPPPFGYSVVARLPGPDGAWDFAGVDPAAHRLYVARTGGVMAIDLPTGAVTAVLVAGQHAHAALPIPGTHDIVTTNGIAQTAVIADGLTGTVKATIRTGQKPDAVVFDPATRSLWIMNSAAGTITVAGLDGRILGTVAVGGKLELGAADGEGLLFVHVEDRHQVAVLDTRARRVLRRFTLVGCEGPTGLAYAPDRRLILSACDNGVTEVSTPAGRLVATLATGGGPDGALYDADRHLGFVPSGDDGTLAVIRLSPAPAVVARIATAKSARTAALDPATGRIYLPSALPSSATGPGRPPNVPGSFAVIVVAPTGDSQ